MKCFRGFSLFLLSPFLLCGLAANRDREQTTGSTLGTRVDRYFNTRNRVNVHLIFLRKKYKYNSPWTSAATAPGLS
jgi:hypothetical protein